MVGIKKSTFSILLLLISYITQAATDPCPVIPLPSSYSREAGELSLRDVQQITVDNPDLLPVAHYLQKELLDKAGLTVLLEPGKTQKNTISLELIRKGKMPAEGYALRILPDGVKVSAMSTEGVFHGINSLLQLVRLNKDGKIACWRIEDAPGMRWRGLMLDESRHFFGKEAVKEILDWMAFYKLNRFHWHLTDKPGWRLEIKSYPKLTLVGGIGNETDSLAAAAFYTQKDINEIVQYARERYIEIIPEIDMPGHATAANRAYPEYSGGGSAKHPDFTFNPGMEETYSYLTQILKEVKVLFPANMIHIGGDEVHFGNEKWPSDKQVQQLMARENLKDIKAVEAYFIQRMADSVIKMNAKVLGWDEIAGTKIPAKEAIIFWWRHDRKNTLQDALNNGYQAVLCPRIPLYFDFIQDSTHISGRKWGETFSSLDRLYNFSLNDYGDVITAKNRDLILGIQANIWSEKISSTDRMEYMLFPRIAALAETSWTNEAAKNYALFKNRLRGHLALYQQAGLKFYNPLTPAASPEIIDIYPQLMEDDPEAN